MHSGPLPKSVALAAEVAPKFADVTMNVLFNDVWERPGLSKRDRSLITVSALISLYRIEQLPYHLKLALTNGVTKEELGEVIAHLAFYASWPCASSAIAIAKKVFDETE